MSGEIEILPPRKLAGVLGFDEDGLAGNQDPVGILVTTAGGDASEFGGAGAIFCIVVSLTQEQYDALPVKNPGVLYAVQED
ncbi:hypothetical protein ACCS91_33380 [Rhizobium ruizarguesonis]